MSVRAELKRYWPLFGLELRTPRLVLRPMSDDDLVELMAAELAGIHDPDQMPFDMPWSTAPPVEMVTNSLKYHWERRAAFRPDDWEIEFTVALDGIAIGVQGLRARNFRVVKGVETGSWIRLDRQGRGIGTEMRAAVLMFAFDELGAARAESAAFVDNPKSRNVSAKLGYRPNGRQWKQRRPDEVAESEQLLCTPQSFVRPAWKLQVSGFDECRSWLGA